MGPTVSECHFPGDLLPRGLTESIRGRFLTGELSTKKTNTVRLSYTFSAEKLNGKKNQTITFIMLI